MDVHCSTCAEAWEVDHLLHEIIFDTALAHEEAEAWCKLPVKQQLSKTYREKFCEKQWQFGQTVINVLRCPCCPPEARANPAVVLTKAAIEDMLSDDLDALTVMFADNGL